MSDELSEGHLCDGTSVDVKDSNAKLEPIAIVGMATRLHGGINSPSDLWRFLLEKRDARGPIPDSRYNGDAFYDETSKPGSSMVNAGYFLDRDLELFDAAAFPLSIPEIESLDPVQRQLLELVRECLESAGEVGWGGKDIGCFVGTFGDDLQDLRSKDTQDFGAHRMTGCSDFAASNRISYVYDFRGLSVTIRTACSASLVALHSACQALYQGDCSSAIVSSANIIMSPSNTFGLGEVGALSPDVSCKTFDATANGYARAEGVAALCIKKLSDAIACKDPIRAVIRSTASNCDGRSSSFTNPNPKAHETLMRTAYHRAGLSPEDTGFVELHGTGTAMGDPIEAGAVAKVFGADGTYITSIKPNLGHSEGASGIVSVIKSVLALENLKIPSNIKFTVPNPRIPFQEAKSMVPTSTLPWPKNKKERVSVNSFGLGGSNAYVIIDSARSLGVTAKTSTIPTIGTPQLAVLSADHPVSLENAFRSCSKYLERDPTCSDDLLFTLNVRREHRTHRCFSILNGTQLLPASRPTAAAEVPKVVFVFTGQGAQYIGMARELAIHSHAFAEDLQQLDLALSTLPHPPSWSLKDFIMFPPKDIDLVAVMSQPLCTAIQIALVNRLRALGVYPAVIVGHSSGEIAAAYAAGAVSMHDAIALSYHRGQSLPTGSRKGGMAAVGMGKPLVDSFLLPGVTIGCENSPSNVTLSGDADVLQQVITAIRASSPQTFVRVLNVDMAYHSYHMKEISNVYSKALEGMSFRSSKIPYFSTAYGRWLNADDVLDLEYWKANLESPVLFNTAIEEILRDEESQLIFLEIGPHSALQGPLRQCFQASLPRLRPMYVPTLVRGQDANVALLTAIGMLHCAGVTVNLKALSPAEKVLHDLPPYPFHHEHIWKENRISKAWRFRQHSRHDILGAPTMENNDLEPTGWNVLRPEDLPWICDHQIGPDIVFPAAAYIAMISEAIRQVTGSTGCTVRRVAILAAMVLHEGQATEILTSLRPYRWTDTQESRAYEFRISSVANEVCKTHCRGQVEPTEGELARYADFVNYPRHVRSSQWYDALRKCGLNYGPSFARLTDTSCSVSEASACALTSMDRALSGSSYAIHPTMIDEAFQLLSVGDARGHPRAVSGTYIPTYIEELSIKPATPKLSIRADVEHSEGIRGSITGWSDGQVVLAGRGVQMSKLEDVPTDSSRQALSGARIEYLPLLRFLEPAVLFRADEDAPKPSYKSFLQHFTHENPRCDILEILESTSSATHSMIETLYSESGERMFASYTLASTEVEICLAVEASLVPPSAVKCTTFDVRRDAAEQGFPHSSYDLIIARNLIETSQSGQVKLKNIQNLLRPCGYLLLDEHHVVGDSTVRRTHESNMCKDHSIVVQAGVMSEHDFPSDNRHIHHIPTMASQLLNEQLCSCGGRPLPGRNVNIRNFDTKPDSDYTSLDSQSADVQIDSSAPGQWDHALQPARLVGKLVSANLHGSTSYDVIIAQPDLADGRSPKDVTLLVPSQASSRVTEVACVLSENGFTVTKCTLDHISPPSSIIVSLLDIEEPFLYNIDQQTFEQFTAFISALPLQQQLIWLTLSADPRYALIHGLARNVRFELGLDFATLKVDSMDNSCFDLLPSFIKKYRHGVGESDARDNDYALLDGIIQAGRFHWYSIPCALAVPARPRTEARLTIGKKGLLQSLTWVPDLLEEEVGDHMVEVKIAAVGMNFKDVLVAMGVVSGTTLGIEASGTLTRVGASVNHLTPGDRVAIAYNGCFVTRIIVPSLNCVSIPDPVSLDDAATLYGVYCTSVLSLMHIARISANTLVLIHSACGGIGLSAIQLCRSVGAEIYATVGSERKRKYLQNTWNIPANNIFNSRDKSFHRDLMTCTNNSGVDVVLNSLSGELLHASWECVADFGMMIELGRRDIQEHGKLDMGGFSRNRGYHAVDYAQILNEKPELNQSLMQEVSLLLQQGKISPITLLQAFEADNIEECFRFFQKGEHIGKVVVHMPSCASTLNRMAPLRQQTRFDPAAAYLLVGGLGGLVRSVSIWMAERGARHLVFLPRSPLSPAQSNTLQELSAMGCKHQVVLGSVANSVDVERAVRESTRPIRGVLQMAASLKDNNISHMTYAEWKSGIEGKVSGTLNLHNSLSESPLDFFIMLASHVGLHGWYGQANYAAGNTYQDAFVEFRHAQELPASVLNIGPVEDIGMTAENPELARRLRSTFHPFLAENDLFETLELAIMRSRPHALGSQIVSGLKPTISSDDANSNLPWAHDARFLIYRNLEEDMSGSSSLSPSSSRPLSEFLTSCTRSVDLDN